MSQWFIISSRFCFVERRGAYRTEIWCNIARINPERPGSRRHVIAPDHANPGRFTPRQSAGATPGPGLRSPAVEGLGFRRFAWLQRSVQHTGIQNSADSAKHEGRETDSVSVQVKRGTPRTDHPKTGRYVVLPGFGDQARFNTDLAQALGCPGSQDRQQFAVRRIASLNAGNDRD